MFRQRQWTRAAVAIGVVALALTGLAGVTAAKDKTEKASGFDEAATYYVTAEVGGGAQQVELLTVGDATISAQCEAWDASESGLAYPYGVGITGGWNVTNNGDNPVAFVLEPGTRFSDSAQGTVWLAPGESSGDGGEWVNEEFPEGNASWQSFAVLDHGGTSATGMLAWSARVNPGDPDVDGDEFGECVFTGQAKG